jgi:hypothetical protein
MREEVAVVGLSLDFVFRPDQILGKKGIWAF